MKFDVLMKPTGMSKKTQRMCPEYLVSVEADDRDAAAMMARNCATNDGFKHYAVSKVKEMNQ